MSHPTIDKPFGNPISQAFHASGWSSDQLAQFEEQGFLNVRQALPAEQVARLREAIGALYERCADREKDRIQWWDLFHGFGNPGGTSATWEHRNIVAEHEAFLDLIDQPNILAPMTQLLGPNIALLSSHLVIRGQSTEDEAAVKTLRLGWHRDLGVSSLDMREPHPRLAVKVAFWLTPLTESNQGAMRIVPGSHRLLGQPAFDRETNQPYGAIEVLAEPGDACFFEQRLWHAGAPNLSTQPRICLFYCYGYRWLRPQDYIRFSEDFLDGRTAIRRQLLGDAVTQMGYHLPAPQDVPLRDWLKKTEGSAV
jgi:hypothetical protein